MEKIKHKDIINFLVKGNFFAECPCCEEEISLKKAGLFDNNNFSQGALEIYEQQLQVIKERKEELKKIRLAGTTKSQVGARTTNIGFILERLAPAMGSFRFNYNDCRSLFDPIDYIIFEGLSTKGHVDKIFFVDIKTGAARLSKKQREIRDVIDSKKVNFKKY